MRRNGYRRDPPRGETYVALVDADNDAGAWGFLLVGSHFDVEMLVVGVVGGRGVAVYHKVRWGFCCGERKFACLWVTCKAEKKCMA